MNAYNQIATKYFRQMEGWTLYRKQGSTLLWVWTLLAVGWLASLYPLLSAIAIHDTSMYGVWFAVVLALELVVLLVGAQIQKRKAVALIDEVNSRFAVSLEDSQACRTLVLTRLLGRAPDSFLDQAKEISELLKLRDQFRGKNEIEPGFFWRSLYDRESKPRLLAVALAGITVFTALTLRSLQDGFTIFEIVADHQIWGAIGTLMVISGALFCMLIGARAIGGVIWHAASIWMVKTLPSSESMTALNYLVRDLVLLHAPMEKHEPVHAATASKPTEAVIVTQRAALKSSSPLENAPLLRRPFPSTHAQSSPALTSKRVRITAQVLIVSFLAFQGFRNRKAGRTHR